MIALSVAEIGAVLGAEVTGPGDRQRLVTAVTADSRAVGPGALFVALPGERADGHTFVAAAYAAGAAAALTRHPVDAALCVVVTDPLVALGRLARHLVDRAVTGGLQVVAITGSQGKTSTKDLLGQVLEAAGPTVAPVGNLNNELGVPLTVSRIDEHTRYLVAEMGARGIGHIAYLCEIAPPRVGVVLNVGQAHVGEFGGQPAIAQAKGELVEALPRGRRRRAERRRPAGLGDAAADLGVGAGLLGVGPAGRPGGLGLRPGQRPAGALRIPAALDGLLKLSSRFSFGWPGGIRWAMRWPRRAPPWLWACRWPTSPPG